MEGAEAIAADGQMGKEWGGGIRRGYKVQTKQVMKVFLGLTGQLAPC